jgi:hypothetical protein
MALQMGHREQIYNRLKSQARRGGDRPPEYFPRGPYEVVENSTGEI